MSPSGKDVAAGLTKLQLQEIANYIHHEQEYKKVQLDLKRQIKEKQTNFVKELINTSDYDYDTEKVLTILKAEYPTHFQRYQKIKDLIDNFYLE